MREIICNKETHGSGNTSKYTIVKVLNYRKIQTLFREDYVFVFQL